MANTYFKFKEFTIHQEKTAMKVCTDACLFGAWVAHKMDGKLLPNHRVLDIGAGTGLLSLMVAQRITRNVEAVEIDTDAWRQATENIQESPWANRIQVFKDNILSFRPSGKYGLILSNPPFFTNDLKASGEKRNLARHEETIRLDSVFNHTTPWLDKAGFWAILVPAHRSLTAITTGSREGLFLLHETQVRQTVGHSPFRSMLLFGKTAQPTVKDEIVIRQDAAYSPEFIALLKNYYLNL